MTRPALAVLAAAAMSVGAIAASEVGGPALAVSAYGVGLAAVLFAALGPSSPESTRATAREYRIGLGLLAVAGIVVVIDRHQLVASSSVAPDDVLALTAFVVAAVVALRSPTSPGARALVYGLVLATYAIAGAITIHAKPYHSDAVVATHAGAELVMAGRHPYASFDMAEQLPRFGLHPDWATDLEDGSSLATLNYPVLAVLVPVPALALGITDIRILYLAEVLALIGLVALSATEPWRAFALAAAVGNAAVMRQFVVAGVDPTWALLLLIAWLARSNRWSAVALGLAVAARQTAWLAAPLILAYSWWRYGRAEALGRTGVAAAVALAVHLPFLIGDAGAVIGGISDIVLRPVVAGGVGPSVLFGLPREAHLAVAAVAFAAVAVVWWSRLARLPGSGRASLVIPLAPLYLASRGLQSYFALLPLFTLVEEGRASVEGAALRSTAPRPQREVPMGVDKELLEILACPLDKAPVREEGDRLVCERCGRRYPVRDGIPVMLIEEAELPPGTPPEVRPAS